MPTIKLYIYNAPINVKPQGGGGGAGIGGVFDVTSLPVAGAFDHCVLWVGTFQFNRKWSGAHRRHLGFSRWEACRHKNGGFGE